MIEVVFGESACGGLRMAQHYGEGKCRPGAVLFIQPMNGRKPTRKERRAAQKEAEEKERLAWERAVPLGGSPGDVYGISLALSMGEIEENVPGLQRLSVLEQRCRTWPDDFWKEEARKLLQQAKETLNAVRARGEAGEPLRIWYSDQPEEACGLYWMMAQMDGWEACGPVTLVKLPEWTELDSHTIVRHNSWGEVAPFDWHRYLPLQKPAPAAFRRSCAAHWKTLQRENAPLRAMLNGRLVSAPATLYDHVIIREIGAQAHEFREFVVIGDVIGKYQLGIGVGWVAYRIEEMIRAGNLEVVTNAAEDRPSYDRILRKCGERAL